MRLSRIYSSQAYLTSKRKDKIHAAIGDPCNAKLVQQFADYLDEDSQAILKEAIKEREDQKQEAIKEAQPEQDTSKSGEEFPDAENNIFSPSYHGGSSFSGGDIGFEDEGEPDIFAEPEGESDEIAEDNKPSGEDVPLEESKAIDGEPITADTSIEDILVDIVSESNVIKGTLNSREDTAGVLRIAIDDNELWIYYKDEVNIGDIMVDVIETLNGANYTYLTFSRLARSNNAIVFDINFNLQEPVKSIKEVEEESK